MTEKIAAAPILPNHSKVATLQNDKSSDWISYYGIVRQAIDKFDELSARLVVEGTTFGIGLLAISGAFFSEAFKRTPPDAGLLIFAAAVATVSIAATTGFMFQAIFYAKLLGGAVEVAKGLERRLINTTAAEHSLRLSEKIDRVKVFGLTLAGKNTWKVIAAVYIFILAIEAIVAVIYVVLWATYRK